MLIKTSRRRFVGGVSAGLLASPFLRMLNNEAHASGSGPSRLLVYFLQTERFTTICGQPGQEQTLVSL